jgi:hypothetical protein
MKNYKVHIIIQCCFLIAFIYTATSQENPVMIKYQDSIEGSLLKHNLKLFAYPAGYENFPCPKVGPPKYKIQRPELPGPEEPDPIRIIGDTSRVFLKAEGDKNVFWIHGLNGNTNSLAVPAKASQRGVDYDPSFPPRKIRSYRGVISSGVAPQLYSEDLGIAATSGDLDDYVHQNMPASEKTIYDFIIAHSQGGIVGREWLRNMDLRPQIYDKYAHGLVTFGTPHGGAEVLNNCRPNLGRNKLPAFVNEACQSLGGAIIIPKLNANFITSLVPSKYMTDIIGSSCGALSSSIIPIVMDDYYKATTKDFYVGATFLEGGTINGYPVQGLNQYTSKVPVVQFYGIEEQPILWRFMSSTLDIGEVQKNSPNSELFFGYTNDNQLPFKVNNMINEFGVQYEYEKGQEKKMKKNLALAIFSAGLNPIAGGALIFYFRKKLNDAKQNQEAYDKGKVWLTNANDYYLTDLIGARESKTSMQCRVIGIVNCRSNIYNPVGSGVPATLIGINYTTYPTSGVCAEFPGKVLNWTSYHYSSPWSNSTVGDCTGSIQQVVSGWVTTYSYKDNDGVVLAESAKYPINVDIQAGNTHSFVLMDRTNHDQMKNCDTTKDGLTKLYDGRFGKFFLTDKR